MTNVYSFDNLLRLVSAFLGAADKNTQRLADRLSGLATTLKEFDAALDNDDELELVRIKAEFHAQISFIFDRFVNGLGSADKHFAERLTYIGQLEDNTIEKWLTGSDKPLPEEYRRQVKHQLSATLGTVQGLVKALRPQQRTENTPFSD